MEYPLHSASKYGMIVSNIKHKENETMKKLLSILLTLALLLGCASAFAEDSATASNLVDFDFGDFTMTFDADMTGEVYEKADNEVYFQIFPFYDENAAFTTNINCVWASGTEDLTQIDASEFANSILSAMITQLQDMELNAGNAQVLLAEPDELGGKYALRYLAQYEIEGTTAFLMQMVVSDAAFGTYTFSVTFADPTHLEALVEIVTSIKWTV